MKMSIRRVYPLAIGMILLFLLGFSFPAIAKEPTLARLSFWVSPERMEAFETAYEERIVPVLGKHGLAEADADDPAKVDGVFSWIFSLESPGQIDGKRKALFGDPAWGEALESLGIDPLPRFSLQIYRTPAGPGRARVAGRGRRQGLWLTFDSQDGLSSSTVSAVLQDRDGNMWFGAEGLCRYDGERFTTFTTEDGLLYNDIRALLEDQDGTLWIGTKRGIARYDGREFRSFTDADGLRGDFESLEGDAWPSLLEDRHGNIWIGTNAGVNRYDGERFSSLSTEDGLVGELVSAICEDSRGRMWFGTESGVSLYDGREFVNFTPEDGLGKGAVKAIHEDEIENLWFGIYFGGVSRYDGRGFTTFTTADGLPDNRMESIAQDRDGQLWFATWVGGVSRYDGKAFTNFSTEDGLGMIMVFCAYADRDGYLWFGTLGGGVSRYDGGQFTQFGERDGFSDSVFMDLLQDRQGRVWIGSNRGGASYYDGHGFTHFTRKDGVTGTVDALLEDRQGNIWLGTRNGLIRFNGVELSTYRDSLMPPHILDLHQDAKGDLWLASGWTKQGVSRFDGERFVRYTTEDGLAGNEVYSIAEDRRGHLWFVGPEGLSRFDGKTFSTYNQEESLVDADLRSVFRDRDDRLWFSTDGERVFRFDGKRFAAFEDEKGLPAGYGISISEDRQGHLWFSLYGGGVSRFDGKVFQNLSIRDGLVNNAVQAALEDREGNIWIATDAGLTRYRPGKRPPAVHIREIVADRVYGAMEPVQLSSSQRFVRFQLLGRSMSTPPDRLVYVYRLEGYDADWQQTRESQVSYADLPVGKYAFEVKAVDRDLNYSEPARVELRVDPPYGQMALRGGLALALIAVVLATGYGLRKRRELRSAERALLQELEEELQTAHDMQMSLMPTGSPQVEGIDIAGRCIPANHVGGDFFQYFQNNGQLSICMADVTGHAMEAAIPVVMFNGILESQMEQEGGLEDLFARLNRSLYRTRVDSRTFVCFTMGEVQMSQLQEDSTSSDSSTRILRLANGGCPYPLHYCAATGEVTELQADAYPLGVRVDTAYAAVEAQLGPGDRIVFCSDGIAEAANSEEEIFGFERTAEMVREGCAEGLSAEELIDRMIGTVKAFAGDARQEDDMTVVVLQVEA